MTDPLRLLALWALVHETADEGWKAAVARGRGADAAEEDRLAALVSGEKDRLRDLLASGGGAAAPDTARILEELQAVRFEIASLRGRLESIESSLDALRPRAGGETAAR